MSLIEKYECLSKKDMVDIFEIVELCSTCITKKQLKKIVNKLKNIISFDVALNTYFDKRELYGGEIFSLKALNFNYPEEFIDRYWEKKSFRVDVPVQAYFQTSKPQNFSTAIHKYNNGVLNEVELEIRDYGLSDGWIYGTDDAFGYHCSIFSVMGGAIEKNKRTKRIFQFITPFLTEAYKNILKIKRNQKYSLTKRELEVLNWIKKGKTSWEISTILNTSKRTIDFHTNNCIYKLNAANRSNAVAIALNSNLIQF